MYRPFTVIRLRREGPKAGPDRVDDVFCVRAKGNHELVRAGDSPPFALLNGSMGWCAREAAQKLCDALNASWEMHYGIAHPRVESV
jgi:hypothetical protein